MPAEVDPNLLSAAGCPYAALQEEIKEGITTHTTSIVQLGATLFLFFLFYYLLRSWKGI